MDKGIPIGIKYLDPSYHIRSVATECFRCRFLHTTRRIRRACRNMGKLNVVIGYWNNFFTHVPIKLATKERRMVELDSALWRGVVSATRQDK